jgi:hypothetical protein
MEEGAIEQPFHYVPPSKMVITKEKRMFNNNPTLSPTKVSKAEIPNPYQHKLDNNLGPPILLTI